MKTYYPDLQGQFSNSRSVVLIGTGFNIHYLNKREGALCSWGDLLKMTAVQAGICPKLVDVHNPTLSWERLVMAFGKNESANCSESALRKILKIILQDSTNALCGEASNKSLDAIMANFKGHLLNLNFDCVAGLAIRQTRSLNGAVTCKSIDKISRSPLRRHDARNLYRRWVDADREVFIWHPHGVMSDSQSMRLGYRDYGLTPSVYQQAFAQFKRWERSLCKRGKADIMGLSDYYKMLENLAMLDANQENDIKPYDTWITRFMLLPVNIIGVGLSSHEIGLHWLLMQRERNLSRVPADQRPPVRVFRLVDMPVGFFDVQLESSWDQAWQNALGENDCPTRHCLKGCCEIDN